jgi:hypothetical protein
MSNRAVPAHLGVSAEDYVRLGIKPQQVEPWEDGLRTNGSKGTYEWWYFDAHLDDGSKLVIDFLTKPIADMDKPLTPCVRFTFDRADGSHVERMAFPPVSAFHAAKERCDVRMGPNTFAGDLHSYQIHLAVADVEADVTLTGRVPAWRPATGTLLFGAHGEHIFAWLPAVPQGDVAATITIAGQTEHFSGNGYHDHNWGNRSMVRLLHHWHWARGQIGDHTLIVAHITAEKRYGYQTFPVFMLAHQGRIIADDGSKVRFGLRDVHPDPPTGKPVANVTVYEYEDTGAHYKLTFTRRQTILRMKFADELGGWRGRLARLAGFDGAFLRFTGDLRLERYDGPQRGAAEEAEAIWEMRYFGHAPKPRPGGERARDPRPAAGY